MATTEQLMEQYGVAWFGFDESSGNVLDKLGNNYVGTVTGATRVQGWNGEGYAMNFSGNNQYVQFNNKIVPIGSKTIRFKIKKDEIPNNYQQILSNNGDSSNSYGIQSSIDISTGRIYFSLSKGTPGVVNFNVSSEFNICDGKWHDILFTWDGTTNVNEVMLYIDDMSRPHTTSTAISNETSIQTNNLSIGCVKNSSGVINTTTLFRGQIDDLQIYSKALLPSDFTKKRLAIKSTDNKILVPMKDSIREIFDNTENILLRDAKVIHEIDSAVDRSPYDLTKKVDKYEKVALDGTVTISTIDNKSIQELLGDSPQAIYYTDSGANQISIDTEVEPYSVYNYISEDPMALVYTESTDDIIVSTVTEPFDIYDEFGDEVEVLYYTDDISATNANLILEANWSPIDELDGDFEVVTWTDEEEDTAKRILEMTTVPKPQFIYRNQLVNVKEGMTDVIAEDTSKHTGSSMVRYLLTNNNTDWYNYNDSYNKITINNTTDIIKYGMTSEELLNMDQYDLSKWNFDTFNIGVFLYDDVRGDIVSSISSLGIEKNSPVSTPSISDASFYILNTTARIELDLKGLNLVGVLDDDDLTRVQYRVKLNGNAYYPEDGEFTELENPPKNIDIMIRTQDIIIGDWNTLEVEFQDYFGKTDTWSQKFVGKYVGIMFSDEDGKYYSDDVGNVLRYLDFGELLTGQISPRYKVLIKNEYGFNLKDVRLSANTQNFANGLKIELSNEDRIDGDQELFIGDIADNGQAEFYIRMMSDINTIPNGNDKFNIYVNAVKDI